MSESAAEKVAIFKKAVAGIKDHNCVNITAGDVRLLCELAEAGLKGGDKPASK
jgi:hypothetical protein